MRRLFILITAFLILLSVTACSVMGQKRNLGFGIVIGEPTGFSLKYMKTETVAFDGAVAWSFADESTFHIHADILHHNWTFLQKEFGITEGALPLYYGIGGRLKFGNDLRAGVRFVVGVSYLFEDGPIDAFFELAPIMDVAPETTLNGNAALGMRYWF